MHELSIAISLIDAAQEEAAKRKVKVTGVCIKLGSLSGVVKEALLASYEMAVCETPLEGSRLVVEDVPVMVRCATCQGDRPIRSLQFFCCDECGAPASEIVQGKELELVALEIE